MFSWCWWAAHGSRASVQLGDPAHPDRSYFHWVSKLCFIGQMLQRSSSPGLPSHQERSRRQKYSTETSLAVKFVKDLKLKDLVSRLFNYAAPPWLAPLSNPPTLGILKRAVAVCRATQEISKNFFPRKICVPVRTQSEFASSDIHCTSLDSHVLEYRPEKDFMGRTVHVASRAREDMDHFTIISPRPMQSSIHSFETPHTCRAFW